MGGEPGFHGLVTRYDEARAIFADARLVKDPRHAWEALRAAGMVRGEPGDATFDLHTTDPPNHTRLACAPLIGVASDNEDRLTEPEQLTKLRGRPELLPGAVEKLLRYDGPTARSSPEGGSRSGRCGCRDIRLSRDRGAVLAAVPGVSGVRRVCR